MRLVLIGALLCGVAQCMGAAPQLPSTPDCIFSGTGEIRLGGEWKAHPVFKKFDQDVKFRFKGSRINGWTTIRYSTDYGEAAVTVDDESTSQTYWYKGEDQVLKSAYDGMQSFQFAMNPFGYQVLVTNKLKGQPLSKHDYGPNKIAFQGAPTVHRNNGTIDSDYVYTKENGISTHLENWAYFNYPKIDLVDHFKDWTIDWSDIVPDTGVAKRQMVVLNYGIQGPRPRMKITITTLIEQIAPIPPNTDAERLKQKVVSGLTKYQSHTGIRRNSTGTYKEFFSKRTVLFICIAVFLVLVLGFSVRKRFSR